MLTVGAAGCFAHRKQFFVCSSDEQERTFVAEEMEVVPGNSEQEKDVGPSNRWFKENP